MQAFEDIQPNELRPSHKGRNVVPIIRTSRPSDHGRATQVMRSRGSAQSAASTSQPRTPDPDPRFNDRLYNVMHAGNERPKKRRRIDTINPEPNNDHARKHNPVITISVPLPPNCLSGAFRCHNHRRSWLKSKTRQIQHEHGVTILSHSYEGSDALFNCRFVRAGGAQVVRPPNREQSPPPSPGHTVDKHDRSGTQSATSELKANLPQSISDPRSRKPNQSISKRPSSPSSFHPGCLTPTGATSDLSESRVQLPADTSRYMPLLHESRTEHCLEINSPSSQSTDRATEANGKFGACASSSTPRTTRSGTPVGHQGLHTTSTIVNDGLNYTRMLPFSTLSTTSFRSGVLRIKPLPDSPSTRPRSRESQTCAPTRECVESEDEDPEVALRSARDDDVVAHRPPSTSLPDSNLVAAESSSRCGSPLGSRNCRNVSPAPSNGGRATPLHELEPMTELVCLGRDSHDKPRRLLVSPSLGILSATMRGAVSSVDRTSPRRGHVIRSAAEGNRHSIDDACLLCCRDEQFIVAAHAREDYQLSVAHVTRDRLKDVCEVDRPAQSGKNRGASAVCAMLHSMMFASGGYDHVVHLWDASRNVSRPSPTSLVIKHTSTVQSLLAIRDTSHKLISGGADCNVHIYDLSSERVVNTLKTSNSVYHIHEALSPFCALLEVAHRELQFEIRDRRLVPREAVQRFGYPSQTTHGRYIKGDVRCGTFACGDKDGVVRLWDLRNAEQPIEMIPCFPGQRIIQVVFDDARLVACSEDHELAYIHYRSGE